MTLILRASSANRWMRCAASAHPHTSDRPDTDNDAAREGTCAAWVAEVVFNGDATQAIDLLGRTHANGWIVDEDMVRHVQGYIDTVYDLAEPGTIRAEVYREMDYPLSQVKVAGTLDVEFMRKGSSTEAVIVDLKYGYGTVEPSSWQLHVYGVMKAMSDPFETLTQAIYQPRAIHPGGPFREHKTTREYVMLSAKRINEVVSNIASGVAEPGSHCHHCVKSANCMALAHSVYRGFEMTRCRDMMAATPQQIADELEMIQAFKEILSARSSAIEAEATEIINSGDVVPGWGLEPKYGKRKLTEDPEVIRGLTGVDAYEKKPVTPLELERRGVPKEMVSMFSTKPFIGKKLTRVDVSDLAKRFGNTSPE